MTHQVVFFQARRIQVPFVTANTISSLELLGEYAFELVSVVLPIVNLEVLLQVGARGELLVAGFAHIRLLSRVDTLVADQV